MSSVREGRYSESVNPRGVSIDLSWQWLLAPQFIGSAPGAVHPVTGMGRPGRWTFGTDAVQIALSGVPLRCPDSFVPHVLLAQSNSPRAVQRKTDQHFSTTSETSLNKNLNAKKNNNVVCTFSKVYLSHSVASKTFVRFHPWLDDQSFFMYFKAEDFHAAIMRVAMTAAPRFLEHTTRPHCFWLPI